MLISSGKSLKGLTSLKVGGTAKFLCFITSEGDLEEFHRFSLEEGLPMIVVGELTNTFFTDSEINALIAMMTIKGIRIMNEFPDSAIVELKAGENWDRAVQWSVSEGLSGIEALSGIPGSVGAAPVQNIGAYGTELADVFVRCRVYDTQEKVFKDMSLQDCQFSYRNSIFKKKDNPYVIVSVTLELKKTKPEIPAYKDVEHYFRHAKRKPTLKQIRDAILLIRSKKLPDPKMVPNCGSFFINPIVSEDVAQKLLTTEPDMPHFVVDSGVKLMAGWLIEKAGLKGKSFGNVSVSKDNALVLTTNGKATYEEVMSARDEIVEEVRDRFGVELNQEPQVIS